MGDRLREEPGFASLQFVEPRRLAERDSGFATGAVLLADFPFDADADAVSFDFVARPR
ncbi:hypothetical protein VQ042_22405 [Aurantimonas sp. A2-1-M11]|uniref:hypothetical protein n=1 Tax=Aurantimonas sp. A2-1-M11 TaxID=3113712 RepID=UPI002F939AE7